LARTPSDGIQQRGMGPKAGRRGGEPSGKTSFVAAHLGVTKSTIERDIQRALKELVVEPAARFAHASALSDS